MAITTMSSAAKATTVLLLIIAASTVSLVSASTFRAYKTGCTVSINIICGWCGNLTDYKGGYAINYSGGRVGRLYFGSGCRGRSDTFARSVRRCYAHPYNSVYIPC